MVVGMAATTKITVTMPNELLAEIRSRVSVKATPSISGFIQQAVKKSLENEAALRAFIEDSLASSGGPLTAQEKAWAKRMTRPRKRSKQARSRSAA
jgi:Arc/MetJ-type ribon-helix-helix transcriptional regulator